MTIMNGDIHKLTIVDLVGQPHKYEDVTEFDAKDAGISFRSKGFVLIYPLQNISHVMITEEEGDGTDEAED